VLDDVGVAEVGVCGEEDRNPVLLARCTRVVVASAP